jgi:adenosylmethionine-8-amino-7-oxononanoate aminotransferase
VRAARLFAPLPPQVVYLPAPALPDHVHADLQTDAGADGEAAERAVALLRAHADELTALVIEPLVQCAGKMAMIGSGFTRRIVREVQRLGIHVVADEIAVAFGRTGRLIASTWADVVPDILCLSKGLSGGVLPLSSSCCARASKRPSRATRRAASCTATPSPAIRSRARPVGRASTSSCASPPRPARPHRRPRPRPRSRGPVERRQHPRPPSGGHDRRLHRHDTIYWMPPLTIDDENIARLAEITTLVIDEVLA